MKVEGTFCVHTQRFPPKAYKTAGTIRNVLPAHPFLVGSLTQLTLEPPIQPFPGEFIVSVFFFSRPFTVALGAFLNSPQVFSEVYENRVRATVFLQDLQEIFSAKEFIAAFLNFFVLSKRLVPCLELNRMDIILVNFSKARLSSDYGLVVPC